MLLIASLVFLTIGSSFAIIPDYDPSSPTSFNDHGVPHLDLDSLESGYHGLVKENETLVEVTPQIRAIGSKICEFRISNKHHGEAPFDIILKEKGIAELRALRVLNCEKRKNYKFDIAAVGCNGVQSENATVHITVIDVNEYAPQFLQPAYVSTVDEGRLYEEVVRVEASDRDCTPKFGDVCKYEILTAEQPFVIDNEGIIRNTEPLDYERSHNYILSVVAYDCGMKESVPAMVTVKVNRVCSPGWRGIPERVDYSTDSGPQALIPSAHLELCDAPCLLRNLRTTLSLATDHIGKGCDRDTYSVQSQRKICGASKDSIDLLPTPTPSTLWTTTLIRDEGREADEIFEFDGENSAAIIPNNIIDHKLAQKFSIGVWIKHRPRPRQDEHAKEHILCAADDHKMNRHHYALFIRNCRLILLLRRDFLEGDTNIFRPAEWRWKIPQVCDDRWHNINVQVDFPHVNLFIDGDEYHGDEKNPEIIDDWPLHPSKDINVTISVGACWQGTDNKTKHYYRGYLAGLSILIGRNEKPEVLTCLRRCQEGIHVPSMNLLQPGTQLLTNSDLTEVRIDGDNNTNVEILLRRIGYTNTRRFPTPGRRNFRLDTTIICDDNIRSIKIPSVQSYVTVLPPPRPGIIVNGTSYIAREYNYFRIGVKVFSNVFVTAGSAARLDACAVSVYPSLNPDHETLGISFNNINYQSHTIKTRIDRDGVVLSGADTPYKYQQLLRLITYTNRKPAYYLDRVFKLTCSELSGRFASNEYIQTLAVIHPKDNVQTLPTKTIATKTTTTTTSSSSSTTSSSSSSSSSYISTDLPPIVKILDPLQGHAQMSRHHADISNEYETTSLHEGKIINGSSTSSSHAITIVAAGCVGFLLLMGIIGATRVRGANKTHRTQNDELTTETEMAWDDSALAITVNPMERLADNNHTNNRDDDNDDSATSDSDDDDSFRDDDIDSSDCDNDCDLTTRRHNHHHHHHHHHHRHHQHHQIPHDLEWDHRDV